MGEAETIAKGLTKAQRFALLAFPDDTPVEMADGSTHYCRAWRKAREVGVSGNTIASMNPLGGVDPNTLLCGPILFTDDWSREGRHWAMTDLGLEVRRHLLEGADNAER